MAGLPWFAVYADFPDHPKSVRLGVKLGQPLAWAHVLKLWAYCARLALDGRVEADVVEHAAGWTGKVGRFIEAAAGCGFIEQDGDCYLVHGWEERNGAHVRKHDRDAKKPRGNRPPAAPVPPPSRAGPERDARGTGACPSETQRGDSREVQKQETAAAARACARDAAGAISKLGPGEAEAAPPPPAVEVSPGPVVSTGALPAAPDEPSEAHPGRAIAGTATAAQVGAPLVAVAAFDDSPPRLAPVFDLVELGPAAAEMRARLELRAEWKFLVAAHDRKVQVRSALEELVEALGVDRAEALCWGALERRRRQGLQPPKTLAFFVPLLEEAQRGGDPLPVEVAGVDIDQVRGQRDLEVEQRWAPLIGAMNPTQREAYEAEKRRLAGEVFAQGLWTTEESRQLDAAEAFLFEKWSRRVKAAGGET